MQRPRSIDSERSQYLDLHGRVQGRSAILIGYVEFGSRLQEKIKGLVFLAAPRLLIITEHAHWSAQMPEEVVFVHRSVVGQHWRVRICLNQPLERDLLIKDYLNLGSLALSPPFEKVARRCGRRMS